MLQLTAKVLLRLKQMPTVGKLLVPDRWTLLSIDSSWFASNRSIRCLNAMEGANAARKDTLPDKIAENEAPIYSRS